MMETAVFGRNENLPPSWIRDGRGRPTPFKNMPIKTCPHCLEDFKCNSGRQVFCSYTCRRNHRTERVHGLAPGQWDALYEAQGGACALCHTLAPKGVAGGRSLVVDHDHSCCGGRRSGSCGKCVRGLLCFDCNTAIGRFGDDAAKLRRAADYLDSHRTP